MWLQAIAIILPRVRDQFGVSNNLIGALSSSTFAGMFLGAFVWGTCTHLETCPLPLVPSPSPCPTCQPMAYFLLVRRLRRPRKVNGVQPHLDSDITCWCRCNLCTVLRAAMHRHVLPRDSSRGACPPGSILRWTHPAQGSMPTDQTLALETLPRANRHLLTSLSIFFSFGSVVAAVAAIIIIPSRSCSPPADTQSTLPNNLFECDIQKDNNGWKVLLFVLATIVRPLYIALTNTSLLLLPFPSHLFRSKHL
jgi:MFS family permease